MPTNPITTPRVVVSPSACALAAYILPRASQHSRRRGWLGLTAVTLHDGVLAAELGLALDTVYRALAELRDLGAIAFTAPREQGRTISIDSGHWVWAAVTAVTATVVPPVQS